MAPIFDYKALNAAGKNEKGIVEAENARAARARLKKQGLMVTQMTEKSASKPSAGGGIPFIGNRVGQKDVTLMTRQLASLIKANIPLVEALNALIEQTENEKLKVTLAQVRDDVNSGSSLAKATRAHPKIFDTIFVNMIEAGESSGTLSLVLLRLADLKEAQMRLRSKIISASTYPALMMGVAGFLMLAIFTFVIPKLAKVFESMNKPMPATTKALLVLSDYIITYWPLIILVAIAGVVMFKRYIAGTGRPWWDRFKLNLPVVGTLIQMIVVTRFSRTMATLLSSNVPILTCLSIAKNLVDNVPIANAIAEARENITEGQSIADPLKRSGEFPPLMIHMIAIGERTGELSGMLNSVADTYEEQVNTRIDGLTSLLEPAMIIGMGGAVGFIVLSVMMPLLEVSNINQR